MIINDLGNVSQNKDQRLKHRNDQYRHYKKSLSKLLRENNLELMSNDDEVLDRIFNLLTENKSVDKIHGLISTTEITKYGGDIDKEKTNLVYSEILEWWDENRIL